ncbi:MAG: hypothetical protein IPP30_13470 [Flavobacterium sp.]|nr:hypothetical protein [Flavobacterium sp.]
MNKRITALLFVFLLCSSCNVSRQTVQIPDYILVPNGKEILGNKGLNAFLFENNTKNLTIEKYLSMKFKGENYYANEYWITIEKNKYKLIIYSNDEFEKYFNSANYAVINLEPENAKNGEQRKFIALSVINDKNEDCLSNGSLFQNIVVSYLKKLKDEYYNL